MSSNFLFFVLNDVELQVNITVKIFTGLIISDENNSQNPGYRFDQV